MNKSAVIQQLMAILKGLEVAEPLIGELVGLIARSGKEGRILTLLVIRLQILKQRGASAVEMKEFESIGGQLYSMHLAGPGFNIRILYGFLQDRSPALLLAFHERANKSKTDYSSYTAPASRRLQEIRKEHENG